DPIAAIGGAFETAAAVAGPKTKTGEALTRGSKIAGFANAGKRALAARPPDYAAVSEAALGIAGQLHDDRRIDDASKIIASANRLKQAWAKRDSDPAGLAAAALDLAQAIQLAKYDADHDETKDADGKPAADPDRAAITERYQRAGRIVGAAKAALTAATAKPRPNYLAALDAVSQLAAELTASKQVDAAALVTAKLDAWTQAVNSKNEAAIIAAGTELGEAISGLRGAIAGEHDAAKQAAQSNLAPGETLPDDGGAELPPGPSAAHDGDIVDGDAIDRDAPADATADPGDTTGGPGDAIGGPSDGGYAITPVAYQPDPQAPNKPAPPRQPSISGKIVAGGPLSNAEVAAIDEAAKKVPSQFRRYIAYAGVIKVGGSLSWRANNPGNLRDAPTKIDTVSGAVGTFAVFATMDDGRAAQRSLYLDKYGDQTVRDAINKLTPPSENDTTAYLAKLEAAGVDLDKDVKSQIDVLMPAVEANEGMITGIEVQRQADAQGMRA
ncbi:MAG TPA: hypothetical protein VF516_23130, partial [Kofleriaceae bacterium]